MKKRIWIGIALGQLVLACFGAASLEVGSWGRIGRWLAPYMGASGADSGWAFFAPGVTGQLRARFEIVYADGRHVTVPLGHYGSHESVLRVGDIIDQFWDDDDEDDDDDSDTGALSERQQKLVASLAGKVLAQYPEAREAVVRLDRLEPVSMADYRAGKRAEWQQIYEARMAYRGRTEGT